MVTIRQDDFITSIADALQFMSYYHPQDYIEALGEAYKAEQSPAAKDAIAQILTNSRMCAGTALRCPSPTWSTRACGAPISIPTTSFAPRSSPIPPVRERTRGTTPL